MKTKTTTAAEPWAVRLRVLRARLDLTQAEIAAKIRMSAGSWCGWENGERPVPPPIEMLLGIVFFGEKVEIQA